MLKKAQGFASVDGVHGVIVWNRYCLRSEKEQEKSRYKVDNLRSPDFEYFEILEERFHSIVRATNKSLWRFTEFALGEF